MCTAEKRVQWSETPFSDMARRTFYCARGAGRPPGFGRGLPPPHPSCWPKAVSQMQRKCCRYGAPPAGWTDGCSGGASVTLSRGIPATLATLSGMGHTALCCVFAIPLPHSMNKHCHVCPHPPLEESTSSITTRFRGCGGCEMEEWQRVARDTMGAFLHSAGTAPIITVIIEVTTLKTTHLRNHAQPIQISKIQLSDACHGSQGPKFCPL